MKDEILIEINKALDNKPIEERFGKVTSLYDDAEYADSGLWEKVPDNYGPHTGNGYNPFA